MTEEGLLDVLVITEEGDGLPVAAQSVAAEPSQIEEEEKDEDSVGGMLRLNEQGSRKQADDAELNESKDDGQNRAELTEETSDEACDGKVTRDDPRRDIKMLEISEARGEDPKKAHRLSPDFPDALYELLCTLQEGRRLNDQRCSFRLESGGRRRRCHSEPNTNRPASRGVVFSSLTSLQREEFFELVATAQARRLDDQRALLERSPPPKPRFRSFRGSIKQLSLVRKPAPLPPVLPKEDLYNMILATQAQGRLEEQRSRAPGPMDDEDFFSLLLKVQGGRMEEQRTELPCMLQT